MHPFKKIKLQRIRQVQSSKLLVIGKKGIIYFYCENYDKAKNQGVFTEETVKKKKAGTNDSDCLIREEVEKYLTKMCFLHEYSKKMKVYF